jgi:hypothetical protein
LVVEELQRATSEPDARSVDDLGTSSFGYNKTTSSGTVDKHFPQRQKLSRYWEIYKEVSIIRQPIRTFSSEVIGPGYYVDTDNQELKEELENWLQHCAIVSGEIDEDFSILLKKAQIQREVKGTALCEKVTDEDGDLYGFKLMKPETVRAFTKPGQTVLLPPDYSPDEAEENSSGILNRLIRNQDFYKNDDGEVAAYVQLDESVAGSDNGFYIPFTRDQIIKLTRDSDVGSIFGVSRIAAVEDRLNSLLKKLDDNDKAIESVSQPFQLFKFGVGDSGPWEPEKIGDFMDEHHPSQFEPGMKQGVQGDIDVDTISGEVAPITEFLDWDLNWIISEMPMPKYALGGFEGDVNQFVSRSQETRIEKQIREARREIENEWTPVLEQKAEELGYDPEDLDGLVIGEDPADLNLVKQAQREQERAGDNTGEGGTDFTRPPASSEAPISGDEE